MRRILLAALLTLVGSSCSTVTPGVSEIGVELSDGQILTSDAVYLPGPVLFSTTNSGELPHTIVVTDSAGAVLLASELILPGATIDVTVDLGGGSYEISCRIVGTGSDGTLFDHYEMGMHTMITGSTPPDADDA